MERGEIGFTDAIQRFGIANARTRIGIGVRAIDFRTTCTGRDGIGILQFSRQPVQQLAAHTFNIIVPETGIADVIRQQIERRREVGCQRIELERCIVIIEEAANARSKPFLSDGPFGRGHSGGAFVHRFDHQALRTQRVGRFGSQTAGKADPNRNGRHSVTAGEIDFHPVGQSRPFNIRKIEARQLADLRQSVAFRLSGDKAERLAFFGLAVIGLRNICHDLRISEGAAAFFAACSAFTGIVDQIENGA